jgi:uncharacterized protein with HEPN domain
MQPEAAKYLFDVQRAAALIAHFCKGKTFDQYRADELLKSGVERQFMIIGEALSQLARLAPDVTERIAAFRQIIAFRNILVHGYARSLSFSATSRIRRRAWRSWAQSSITRHWRSIAGSSATPLPGTPAMNSAPPAMLFLSPSAACKTRSAARSPRNLR